MNDDPMREPTRTRIATQFMEMDRALQQMLEADGVGTGGNPRVNAEEGRIARLIHGEVRDKIRLMCLLANHAELAFDTDLTGTLVQEWDRLFKSVMKVLARRRPRGTFIGTPRLPKG